MPDIQYIRTDGRRKYISIAKHQSIARNKYAKWLSLDIERSLFDYADYGGFIGIEVGENNDSWVCDKGNMWALQKNRTDVGSNKEQFGFFQKPSNENDEWHGFPIIPFSKSRYCISEKLLQRWIEENVITEDDIPAIIKKKRI